MKRIISIIAVVAMLFTLAAVFSSCGSGQTVPNSVVNKPVEESSEKVKWTYDNTTYTLSIVGDKNDPVPMFSEKAPKSPDDIPWKDIRNYVLKVEIVGVTDIPDYAFYSMISLKEIKWDDSEKTAVTSIGKCAFAFCSVLSLADVNDSKSSKPFKIPEGVTSIGESAFEGCSSLTEVKIPSTVTKVGENAFAYNYNLKKVVAPEKLEFPDDAFIILSGNKTKPNDSKINFVNLEDQEEEPKEEETEAPEKETEADKKDETETEASTNSETKDEEKPDTATTIIAISIIAIVIIGVVVGAILLMRSNKKQTKDARTVRKNDNDKANKNGKNGKNNKGKKK